MVGMMLIVTSFFLFYPDTESVEGLVEINSNETWSGNYTFCENILIKPGVTLTIQEGTRIKISDGINFSVKGTLIINGSSTNHVEITANSTKTDRSTYMGFDLQSGKCIANYLDMHRAEFPFQMRSAQLNLSNCHFTNYSYAVWGKGGTLDVKKSTFKNGGYGIVIEENTGGNVSDSSFTNQVHDGITLWRASSLQIDNCSFIDSDYGVAYHYVPSGGYVTNCNFENNTYGTASWSSDASINNNTYVNNSRHHRTYQGYSPLFRYNRFLGFGTYTVENLDKITIDARLNWWFSNNSTAISMSLFGSVAYIPFLTSSPVMNNTDEKNETGNETGGGTGNDTGGETGNETDVDVNVTDGDQTGPDDGDDDAVDGDENNEPKPMNNTLENVQINLPDEEIVEGDKFKLTASAIDGDLDDVDGLRYDWYIEGTGYIGSGKEIEIDLPEGEYIVRLKVTDSRGENVEVSRTINVVDKEDRGNQKMIIFILILIISVTITILVISSLFYMKRRRVDHSEDEMDITPHPSYGQSASLSPERSIRTEPEVVSGKLEPTYQLQPNEDVSRDFMKRADQNLGFLEYNIDGIRSEAFIGRSPLHQGSERDRASNDIRERYERGEISQEIFHIVRDILNNNTRINKK